MNKSIFLIPVIAMGLAGCNDEGSADSKMRQQQEQLSAQGNMSVGMPSITNFAEKRMMKDIIEMRDRMVPTYTYLVSEINGVIGEKVCDSLGFGLPGATQYTNPQKIAISGGQTSLALPQADPNGLFTPAAMDGTWIMCKVPGTDKIMPQYIEPKVLVLTFPKESRK